MKITIIGVGNMGSAIMKGLSHTQNFTLSAMNPVNPRVTSLAEELGFKLVNTNSEVGNLTPDIVILTTPAPTTTAVAKELAVLNDHTIFISAAAGITHEDLAKVLPNKEIVNIIGGCGPAFVDVMMDAMSDAAVKHGLDRQTAYEVIASMVKGTGTLAYDSKLAPALLRDQVTSPAGTTIKGVEALEKNGFRYAMMDAVDKANGEA